MRFRELRMDDLERINQIYENFFQDQIYLPSLNHTIGNGVISNDNDIVAFGMVRLYPEAIIVIDQDASPRNKGIALKLLFDEAIKACKNKNFKELNATVHNNKYGDLLSKHFGFKDCGGKTMQINLKE